MKKSLIDIENAKMLYYKYKSLHKVAKELHTSHIRLSKILMENGVNINKIGNARELTKEELNEAIDDYLVNHLKMEEIAKKYKIRIHKLRNIFNENGIKISKWNGHIKKEKLKPVKNKKIDDAEYKICPYCGWKTKDIFGKAHSYQIHLVHKHNIDLDAHLSKYPDDLIYLKDEIKRVKHKIQCKICGKWLYTIDNRHLAKHGINKHQYVEMYGVKNIMSDDTKCKLQENLNKMNKNKNWERKTSKYEKEIEDFLLRHNVKYEKHNREILDGLELDFLIGDYAIEFNGNKFHTEQFGGKDSQYHLSKTEVCNSKGIKLLQIFEDEYKYHKEIVYSKISHILKLQGGMKKIPGRKCIIKEIMPFEAQAFLDKNHIQGFVNSTIYIGAYFENELIAVMSFKQEKKDEWDLNRFASNIEYLCQGVGGKLFSFFKKSYNPRKIKSFADRRWTLSENNNLYTKLGFKLDKVLNPDYRYYNEHVDKFERFHKFNFRKQILHKKYGLPLSMTELEMTKQLGYDRIWDCGLFKYIWTNQDNVIKTEEVIVD